MLGLIAGVLALTIVPAAGPTTPPFTIPWWLLIGFFYVAEAKVIHLHVGRSAHSFSMSEIPIVIGLFLVAPAEYIVARIVGSALALLISRRQQPVKLAFNTAQFTLCAVISVAILHLVSGPGGELGPNLWIVVLLAMLVDNFIGVLCVATAIFLAEAKPQWHRIPRCSGSARSSQ